MIKYVLYEAELHIGNDKILITGIELAKKYGLRKGVCKVVKFGKPETIPENTNKIAYIHLYPQIEDKNYAIIKKTIINV